MKLVLLDKKTIGEDIDFSGIYALGDVTEYDSHNRKKFRNGSQMQMFLSSTKFRSMSRLSIAPLI